MTNYLGWLIGGLFLIRVIWFLIGCIIDKLDEDKANKISQKELARVREVCKQWSRSFRGATWDAIEPYTTSPEDLYFLYLVIADDWFLKEMEKFEWEAEKKWWDDLLKECPNLRRILSESKDTGEKDD